MDHFDVDSLFAADLGVDFDFAAFGELGVDVTVEASDLYCETWGYRSPPAERIDTLRGDRGEGCGK